MVGEANPNKSQKESGEGGSEITVKCCSCEGNRLNDKSQVEIERNMWRGET